MSVDQRIATPEGKRQYVRALFATIADRYDLITRLLSYGQDHRWKVRMVNLLGHHTAGRALDLATGTGDIALLLEEAGFSDLQAYSSMNQDLFQYGAKQLFMVATRT